MSDTKLKPLLPTAPIIMPSKLNIATIIPNTKHEVAYSGFLQFFTPMIPAISSANEPRIITTHEVYINIGLSLT